MFNKCAIDGILLPCQLVVGLISAPVAIKRMLFKVPLFTSFNIFEQKTEPAHPHPEPPA